MHNSSESYPNSIPVARFDTYEQYSGGVFGLWILPLILSTFGVVVIASMTGWTLSSPGLKQAVWFVIALGGFIVVTQIPLKFWYKYSLPLLILSLGMMALTVASPLL